MLKPNVQVHQNMLGAAN